MFIALCGSHHSLFCSYLNHKFLIASYGNLIHYEGTDAQHQSKWAYLAPGSAVSEVIFLYHHV